MTDKELRQKLENRFNIKVVENGITREVKAICKQYSRRDIKKYKKRMTAKPVI